MSILSLKVLGKEIAQERHQGRKGPVLLPRVIRFERLARLLVNAMTYQSFKNFLDLFFITLSLIFSIYLRRPNVWDVMEHVFFYHLLCEKWMRHRRFAFQILLKCSCHHLSLLATLAGRRSSWVESLPFLDRLWPQTIQQKMYLAVSKYWLWLASSNTVIPKANRKIFQQENSQFSSITLLG